jgi:DNA-binding transcriptional regulator YiaG
MISEQNPQDPIKKLAAVAAIRREAASGEMRRRRVSARVTVTELAATLGTSVAALSQWERGQLTPQANHALAWDAALRSVEGPSSSPQRGAS